VKKYPLEYVLTSKYPMELPYMNISIMNDSSGNIDIDGKNDIIFFKFHNEGRYLSFIDYISDTSSICLSECDTILHTFYKQALFVFQGRNKFIFNKNKACSKQLKLVNKNYIYKSKQRKIELSFIDDSTCIFRNTFNSADLEEKYRIIEVECYFIIIGSKIVLQNKNPNINNTDYADIPSQENCSCEFLNKEKRHHKFYIGPYYPTDYQKFGMIPNITTDTLHIINKSIFLFKKAERGSMTFIFK
jgi:hypothetical protein